MPKLIHDLPNAPPAVGPYSIATEANGFVFVSGQIGLDPGRSRVVDGGTAAETRRIMENLKIILGDLDLTLAHVVKTTVFLADIKDFAIFNEIYGEYFAGHDPARSTVEVANLPLGVNVEIEIIAARD
jgi:2-iminobutanoate/2-iminopropanoate deaminase